MRADKQCMSDELTSCQRKTRTTLQKQWFHKSLGRWSPTQPDWFLLQPDALSPSWGWVPKSSSTACIVNIRKYKLQSQPMLKQCLTSGVPGFSFEGVFQALKFGAPPTLFIKPHYSPPETFRRHAGVISADVVPCPI